jgi:hypothetical protein
MPRAENQEFSSYFVITAHDGRVEVNRFADIKQFAAVQESRQTADS